MLPQVDKERMQTLLKDTITMLCKNGLAYNTEFCVEALIGITLDKDDVMLVSINETIRSKQPVVEKVPSQADILGKVGVSSPRPEGTVGSVQSCREIKIQRATPIYRKRVREQSDAKRSNYFVKNDTLLDENAVPADFEGSPAKMMLTSSISSGDHTPSVFSSDVLPRQGNDPTTMNTEPEVSNTTLPKPETMSEMLASPPGKDGFQGDAGDAYEESNAGGGWGGFGDTPMLGQGLDGSAFFPPATDEPGQNQPAPEVEKDGGCRCKICDKVFSSKTGYAEHVRVHTGRYRYYCWTCNRGFMKNNHYEGHMNKHQNRRPFQCKKCHKGFSTRTSVARHERLTCIGSTKPVVSQ